jgi:mRNA-degrading endonuclease toxin of MazEF toxin-antitoxin module
VKRRSKVMLTHLRGVDKRRITNVYGTVSAETMRRVEEALKVATGLIEF